VTLRQKYLKILATIVPVGAFGTSLLLGSVAPAAAKEDPLKLQPRAYEVRVSDRLAAIRRAVSEVAGSDGEAAKEGWQLAWWGNWRNGGAWRNGGWGGGWRNGGWGGGWRNGGWGAGWRNGWPNFWRNW